VSTEGISVAGLAPGPGAFCAWTRVAPHSNARHKNPDRRFI